MKKRLLIVFMLVLLLFSSGCGTKRENESDSLRFKEEYESLNNNSEYRSVKIDKDNPFVYIETSELIKKIERGETFYVYFGDEMCPWCRSVIEAFIKSAKEKNINKVYYVSIWDGDHEEILRDKYILNNDKLELVNKGSDDYYKLLKHFDNVLPDYTLTNSLGETVEVGEKRIFAPNFIYVRNGKANKLVDGISSKQENYDSELTDDIIKEEKDTFKDFLSPEGVCNKHC